MTRPTLPACLCDACDQGRKSCPCPDSCGLPDEEAVPFFRGPDALVAVVCVAIGAVVVTMEWACLLPGGCV